METDWTLVFQVIAYGFTAVFLVLTILMFAVKGSSAVIMSLEKRSKETGKGVSG